MEYELYHWGVRGMKWGQRRYQNKDGSLTPAGKKRYQKNTGASGPPEKKPESSHKSSIADISTEELRTKTDRLNAEKNYFDAKRGQKEAYDKLYPKSTAKVQENFAKKFFNDAVKPALVDVGKKQIESYLNTEIERLTKGKVDKNSIEYLKKANEKQDLRAKIADNTQKEMKAKHKIEKYKRGEWD